MGWGLIVQRLGASRLGLIVQGASCPDTVHRMDLGSNLDRTWDYEVLTPFMKYPFENYLELLKIT